MKYLSVLLPLLAISCGQNSAYVASQGAPSSAVSSSVGASLAESTDSMRVTSAQELNLRVKCSWAAKKGDVECQLSEDEDNLVVGYQYNLEYKIYDSQGLRIRDAKISKDSKKMDGSTTISLKDPTILSYIEVKSSNPNIKIEESTIEVSPVK